MGGCGFFCRMMGSLVPRLPRFLGGYVKESAFFRIATEKAGKPGDEAK